MHGDGKSDTGIVPKKPANKGRGAPRPAESVEERPVTKGNRVEQTRRRVQNREVEDRLQQALDRIRQAARQDKKMRFTSLWHHVYDVDRLRRSFYAMKRKGAPGVDGVTWQHYEENLEHNLLDLSGRLARGAYRAKPVKRVYIPKADGRERPIGIPTLEDKVVQRTAAEVLGAIYETDFIGFSYGFRPGRGQHDALDAVAVVIQQKSVNWVLDADIRGFFDAIDHEWLVTFVEHRIADQRVIRHIRKWLKAGVLENGKRRYEECGTPQGGSISPLLANIYLHYVLDLWTQWWRRTQSNGDVYIVRYADDFVMGFRTQHDGERFMADLSERLARFGLALHDEKTRLIEFGRYAANNRARRGEGKPETFNFLGFTHYCGQTRRGAFVVKRKTMRKRMQTKLKAIKEELRRRMHWPIYETRRWLARVLDGHFRYYGVPFNIEALSAFRYRVLRLWKRVLSRRSQKGHVTWERMARLAAYLPRARILHPYPNQRFARQHPR